MEKRNWLDIKTSSQGNRRNRLRRRQFPRRDGNQHSSHQGTPPPSSHLSRQLSPLDSATSSAHQSTAPIREDSWQARPQTKKREALIQKTAKLFPAQRRDTCRQRWNFFRMVGNV